VKDANVDEGVLDPWVAEWLQTNPSYRMQDILEMARTTESPWPVTREMARVTDEAVAGVPVRIYEPEGRPTGLMVYFHGGGMCIGSIALMDNVAREIAHACGAVVVSVEYRLAPENPHPAPVEDCYAALVWMVEHAEELGFDPNRLALYGGSAGGGLVLGIARWPATAADRPSAS
jgi:acetyl esterase